MTSNDFRAIRKKYSLRQADMAKVLGLSFRSVVYYEHGQRPIPGPVSILMQLVNEHGPNFLPSPASTVQLSTSTD